MNSKNSTIWYNQPWLGFLGTFIFGLLNLYQVFYNNDLKNQVYSLEKSRDSLINEVFFLKENIVTLKSDNYHLKEKLSLYKDSLFVLKSNNLKEK